MNSVGPTNCPCGSGRQYASCCGAVSAGTAFEVGDHSDHLLELNDAAEKSLKAGDVTSARAYSFKSLDINPDFIPAIVRLARISVESRNLSEAITYAGKAVELSPGTASFHMNLGGLYKIKEDWQQAADCFEGALRLVPANLDVLMHLVECYVGLKKTKEAAETCKKAASGFPQKLVVQTTLGALSLKLGELKEAEDAFRAAHNIAPDSVDVNLGLGDCMMRKGMFRSAIGCYERALEKEECGQHGLIYSNMASCKKSLGDSEGAITAQKIAINKLPGRYELASNLLMYLNYSDRFSADEVYSAHKQFEKIYGEKYKCAERGEVHRIRPKEKLRIGYVSSNFYQHAVANFVKPILEYHDPDKLEVIGYHDSVISDSLTERLRSLCLYWRNVAGLSDMALASLIREDRIDILVDLNGHTAGNRMMVFARKPAPLQVTWIGYPNTTGLTAVDYRITDSIADPPGYSDRLHAEHLIRMPKVFCCYSPPEVFPDVVAPPVSKNGFITFGSFNNYAKVTNSVIDAWGGLLNKVDDAHLLLKSELFLENESRECLYQRFMGMGIQRSRIHLLGKDDSRVSHLQRYNSIDISLDTFPYCGTTTTCESLWMGVPVVTLAGKVHAARVGASILSAVGFPGLIADSPGSYIDISRHLAFDTENLGRLRAGLRERMRLSPLMAAEEFVRSLEEKYVGAWKNKMGSQRKHTGRAE